MKWVQIDKYHLECAPYKVCKKFVAGKAFYEAWIDKACLGVRSDLIAAKQLAEKDKALHD